MMFKVGKILARKFKYTTMIEVGPNSRNFACGPAASLKNEAGSCGCTFCRGVGSCPQAELRNTYFASIKNSNSISIIDDSTLSLSNLAALA
jgi:hypothetical protein